MHSSRMRTVRSSSHVYPSMHWAEGVVCIPACTGQGGCLPRGTSAWGGSAQGVSAFPGGHVSQHALRRGGCLPWGCLLAQGGGQSLPPVNRMTDRQIQKHYLAPTSFARFNKTETRFSYILLTVKFSSR